MLVFREWLALDTVRSEVYVPAMREAVMLRAAERTVEFALKSIFSNPRMIAEEAESPTELEQALNIYRAGQAVRWSAMIDRSEMVEAVRKIFTDSYLPLLKERTLELQKMVDDELMGYDNPDDKKSLKQAITKVARKLEISSEDLESMISRSPSTRSESRLWESEEEEEEDDWDMPDDMESLIKDDFEQKLANVIEEVKPLLTKLEYIKEGDLDVGSSHEKLKLLDKSIRLASEEKGNEVPPNETTSVLKKDKSARAKIRQSLMKEIYDKFADYADYQGHSQGVAKFFDPTQQRPRDGETIAVGQFLSDALDAIIDSLTKRPVSKEEGARPWPQSPYATGHGVGENPESWAKHFMNKIKNRIRWETSKREGRAKSLSQSDSEDDEGRLVSIHAGRKDDDGGRGTIDPADYRTHTSERQAENSEKRKKVLDAFVHAMRMLKQTDSLLAVIACVRFGLDCDADGDLPAGDEEARAKASKILSLVPTLSATGDEEKSETIEGFLAKLGVGIGAGASEIANQKMVERIQELGAWDLLGKGRSGSPKNPDGTRMTKRPVGDPEGVSKWDAFAHTVRDAMGEALKKIGLYMNVHLSGSGEAIVSGRVDPSEQDSERWDLNRFLRRAFPRSKIKIEGSKTFVTFFKETGDVKHVWSIEVKNERDPITRKTVKKIEMSQEGFPGREVFEIPQPIKCHRCGGEDERCPSCMGWGYILDIPKISEMERMLIDRLPRQKRKPRGSKQPSN